MIETLPAGGEGLLVQPSDAIALASAPLLRRTRQSMDGPGTVGSTNGESTAKRRGNTRPLQSPASRIRRGVLPPRP